MPKKRAARERRCRIDTADSHGETGVAKFTGDESRDRTLAGSRRSCNPDSAGMPELRMKRAEYLVDSVALIFDDAHGAREGRGFSRGEIVEQPLSRAAQVSAP